MLCFNFSYNVTNDCNDLNIYRPLYVYNKYSTKYNKVIQYINYSLHSLTRKKLGGPNTKKVGGPILCGPNTKLCGPLPGRSIRSTATAWLEPVD